MMTAAHRRPLAAFLLVSAAGCLILASGRQTPDDLVRNGVASPPAVAVPVGPDMVLGQPLRDAPRQARPTVKAPSSDQSAPGGDRVLQTTGVVSSPPLGIPDQAVTASVQRVSQQPSSPPSAEPANLGSRQGEPGGVLARRTVSRVTTSAKVLAPVAPVAPLAPVVTVATVSTPSAPAPSRLAFAPTVQGDRDSDPDPDPGQDPNQELDKNSDRDFGWDYGWDREKHSDGGADADVAGEPSSVERVAGKHAGQRSWDRKRVTGKPAAGKHAPRRSEVQRQRADKPAANKYSWVKPSVSKQKSGTRGVKSHNGHRARGHAGSGRQWSGEDRPAVKRSAGRGKAHRSEQVSRHQATERKFDRHRDRRDRSKRSHDSGKHDSGRGRDGGDADRGGGRNHR